VTTTAGPPAAAPQGSGPGGLSADEARVWRLYFESSLRLEARLNRELRQSTGLTLVDYNVLLALTEARHGCLRMGELAAALVTSPSRLTYQVASMEQRGLVRRDRASDDGRGQTASLTAEGRRAFRAARAEHRRSVRRLFLDHLAPSDLTCLEHVFAGLHARLSAPDAAGTLPAPQT
jgi:DNA-binding MarR family transcriptional regulator